MDRTEAVYPARMPMTSDMGLDIDRITLRRRIMSSLLRHGADGVWGRCYCGLTPRGLNGHYRDCLATETGMDRDYIDAVMDAHHSAIGRYGATMHCKCGETYDDSLDHYGSDVHRALALAGNLDPSQVRRMRTHRWPDGEVSR